MLVAVRMMLRRLCWMQSKKRSEKVDVNRKKYRTSFFACTVLLLGLARMTLFVVAFCFQQTKFCFISLGASGGLAGVFL